MNLTTDVIVGHPAETEAAFAATLRAAGEAGFTKVHVFPYSPRPGTADGGRAGVAAAVKRRRCAELRALSDARGAAHRAAKRGRRERVLVETAAGRGHSDDLTAFVVPGAAAGRASSTSSPAAFGATPWWGCRRDRAHPGGAARGDAAPATAPGSMRCG